MGVKKSKGTSKKGEISEGNCAFCNKEKKHVLFSPAIDKPKMCLICGCGVRDKNGKVISETATT